MNSKFILTTLLTLSISATGLCAATKDGDLVMNKGTLFVIRDGKRCPIKNMEQFKALGFKWADVQKISDEEVNAIPLGKEVETPKTPAVSAPPKAAEAVARPQAFKDGELVENKGAVFVIRDGERCLIKSMEEFKAMGFKWSDVRKISDEEVSSIPVGAEAASTPEASAPPKAAEAGTLPKAAKAKDGELVENKGTIFVIRDGKRCLIKSMEDFKALGFKWADVRKISDEEASAIPRGSNAAPVAP